MDLATQFLLDESGQSASAAPAAPEDGELLDAYSQAVVAAAERVGPAVVHLEVELGANSRRGTGSGFAFTPDGLLLTNSHVVHGARRVKATFADGFSRDADLLGEDPDTDIAVLRIGANALPSVVLGSSRGLRPGQWAIAIGNPYGFQHTVTAGVVSSVDRPVKTGDRSYERLIQTDAAINPGNSGGPLIDIQGRVIGINTVVLADAQGIGFAIPIDVAQRVAQELVRYGHVNRPWTGLSAQTITREIANYLGMAEASGAIVDQVVPDSPAAEAGLRPGDIILQLQGKKIGSGDEVRDILKKIKIGDHLRITV